MENEIVTPVDYKSKSNTILILGILSLVLGFVPGIILAAIGKNKALDLMNYMNPLTDTAKVGNILCKAGFWVSIATTIFIVLYILFVVVLAGLFAGMAYAM